MNIQVKTIDLGAVNCYLIKTNAGFILIDTGGCTIFDVNLLAIRETLEKELQSAGCAPGNLKLIVLTHGDLDHAGNCAFLQKKYGAKIAIHSADAYLVENGELVKGVKFKPFFLKFIMNVFFGAKLKQSIVLFERFKPDLCIDEDFDLSKYGFDAMIVPIPGHTMGSIGVLTSHGDLICGDILCNTSKPAIAPNACDFKELYSSVERLKKLPIQMVYPGHGRPFPMSSLSI